MTLLDNPLGSSSIMPLDLNTCSAIRSLTHQGVHQNKSLWSGLHEVCELLGITHSCNTQELKRSNIAFQHIHVKSGQPIYRSGETCESLYVINSGFVKTIHIDDHGNEQILSFPVRGDILGIDTFHTQTYSSEAVALSECDVIVLPYKTFLELTHQHKALEFSLLSLISRELVREQTMISMLNACSAEAKVAKFLLNLSEKFGRLGYSRKNFILRMTRQEIGSYLGLTLETVSRTLSALHELSYIRIHQKEVALLNIEGLSQLRRFPSQKTEKKLSSTIKKNKASRSLSNEMNISL